MLVVISPAKKMDMTPVEVAGTTEPAFAEDAAQLAEVARGLDVRLQVQLHRLLWPDRERGV